MLQAHQSPFHTLKPRMHQIPDDRAEQLIAQLFRSTAKGRAHRTAKAHEWLKFIEHINPSLFILTDRQLIHLSRFANANEEVDMSIDEINRLLRQVKREVPSTIYDQRADYTDTYDNESLNDNNEAVINEGEEDHYDLPTILRHRNSNYSGERSQQQQQQQQQPNSLLAAIHARHNIPYEETPSDSFFEDKESINHPGSATFQLPVRRRMPDGATGSDYDQLTELNLLRRDKAELTTRIREFNMKTGQMEQEIEQQKHIATEAIQKEEETQKKVEELQKLIEEYKTKLIVANRQMQEKDEEINRLRIALGNTEAGELFDETKLLYEELEKEIEAHKGIKNQLAARTEENARLKTKILELERKASTASIVSDGELDQLKKAIATKDEELDTVSLKAKAKEAHMNSIIQQQIERFNALKSKSDTEIDQLHKTLSEYKDLCEKYKAESKASRTEVTEVEGRLNASKKTLPQKLLMSLVWGPVIVLAIYVLTAISVYVRVNQILPGAYDAPFRFMNVMAQWILSEDFNP